MDIELITGDAPSPTVSEVLAALIDRAVDLTTEDPGYPAHAYVMRVDWDGDLVVCEIDDRGVPITNSTWAVPQREIKRVRVTLGDAA